MRISAIVRIALALVGVVVGIMLTCYALNFFPDDEQQRLESRKTVCENIAVQCCLAAQRNDGAMLQAILNALHARNPDVLSAGLRRDEASQCLYQAGPHDATWRSEASDVHTTKSQVPIFSGKKRWGRLEVCFSEPEGGFLGRLSGPTRAVAFIASAAFLMFLVYLKRMLQYLDPAAVVPDRVRQALDTLAEGVVIVDPRERIVLANRSFAQHLGKAPDDLQGRRVRDLGLNAAVHDGAALPWQQSLKEGEVRRGVMITLAGGTQGSRTFAVNSTPILDAKGHSRGALATFDDITNIERKNKELQDMLHLVKQSRDEIRRQNDELTRMATCDVLTGCFNRRYLFSHLEKVWNDVRSGTSTLACIMLDIDHFKSVNDTHGHAKGDAVLQEVAERLQAGVDSSTLVCRYGGEEFCIVLAEGDLHAAAEQAERLRGLIANSPIADLKISSSFGVTSIAYGARQPAEMIDQADKALYFSKHNGRNRVTKFCDLPADFSVAAKKKASETAAAVTEIPFHAVTALLTALLYRDSRTADHSRRVADLAVALGGKYLSQTDCYVLEVAALLHDIGKIGVPDAILLKPGALTREEWEVMQVHDQVGIEILNAAFSCPRLTKIVGTHHAWYAGNPRDPDLPVGEGICVEARILAIVDAYDAIVSDRVYRRGRSHEEAVVELRRCAGVQFDAEIVEAFIDMLDHRPELSSAGSQKISKSAALQIGLHIERLATAVDSCDTKQLSISADRLSKTAAYVGIEPISKAAQNVAEIAAGEPELTEVVRLMGELLDLCRSTQRAFLAGGDESPRDVHAPTAVEATGNELVACGSRQPSERCRGDFSRRVDAQRS